MPADRLVNTQFYYETIFFEPAFFKNIVKNSWFFYRERDFF